MARTRVLPCVARASDVRSVPFDGAHQPETHMADDRKPSSMTILPKPLLLGMGVALFAGALEIALLILALWAMRGNDTIIVMIATLFFTVPVVMGMAGQRWWRQAAARPFDRSMIALLHTLLVLVITAVVGGEGVICLVIVSPLIVIGVLVGMALGEGLITRRSRRLNTSVALVLVVLTAGDAASDHVYFGEVTSSIVIHASPDRVWRHLASFPPITAEPHYWLFSLGLPMPTGASIEGDGVGAHRVGFYSGGIAVDEAVTASKPGRELSFDITTQLNHPEALGHLQVDRGSLILIDNNDGTTTLMARSWYRLRVAPAWYFDLWVRSIMGNVHSRVMEHIRDLAEQEP
jgi:hypothetical protein